MPLARLRDAVARRWRVWQALRRARAEATARLAGIAPQRLLVVCYGNIYRSPFVAAVLANGVGAGLEVRSAGFHQRVGRETPREFQAIAQTYGIELGMHRSRLLDTATIDWADVVLVMDRHNWVATVDRWPDARPKIIWLGGLLGEGSVEIEDPYGRSEAEVKAIAERLYQAAQALQRRLAEPRLRASAPG